MSSTDQSRDRKVRRTVNPATAAAEELLTHLAADPAAGLSPKEAARRLEVSSAAPLFRAQPRRFSLCLRQILREPALWLLLAVSVIALFFDRILLGAVCLLLAGGNAVLNACLLYRADRTEAAMLAHDAPLARVLRGRRILRVSAEGLVKGDILLLYPGDIIPADCRLLRTEDFSVSERELDAADPHRPAVYLKKDADAQPNTAVNLRLSPVNMVFAGGMAETGFAMALVVAVGSETHAGGLMGEIPTPHRHRTPALFKRYARVLSIYNLAMIALIVPLTAVGIFTLGERYAFLDIFLSALALASLALTEHMLARGYCLAAAPRRLAALDRDRDNTADVKSPAAHEALSRMTDLLLVGTAPLHDGACHPTALYVGDTVYRCDRPEADEAAKAAAEYLYLYRRGILSLPTPGQEVSGAVSAIPALCEWAEIDADALSVRVKELRPDRGGVTGLFPCAEGNRRITVRVAEQFSALDGCAGVFDGLRVLPLDSGLRNDLYRTWREAERQGSTPVCLITEEQGTATLRAVFTYAPHICRRTAGCIKNLERSGIRVAAFLRDESDGHPHTLTACGLTELGPISAPPPDGRPRIPASELMEGGCRAFVGCSREYIAACIASLKAEGRVVGVLASEREDLPLLSQGDLAFACTPSLYAAAESGIPRLSGNPPAEGQDGPDGTPDGEIACDRTRRCAHVLVRRSTSGGGGVLGVRRALLAADRYRDARERTLRFLLLSQTVRTVMTVFPLLLGLTLAAAPVLLLSGLLVDLLVMGAALGLPVGDSLLPRARGGESLSATLRTHRAELISAATASVIPWIVAGIAALLEADFGGDLLYFGMLCTLGLQLAVFASSGLPRRNRGVFFTGLVLGLIYVAGLAASLAAGLGLLWTILLPLTAPAAYLLIRAVLIRVLPAEKKGSTPKKTGNTAPKKG